jgi:hypothetical protein
MLTEKPRKFFFEENEEKKLYEKIKVWKSTGEKNTDVVVVQKTGTDQIKIYFGGYKVGAN